MLNKRYQKKRYNKVNLILLILSILILFSIIYYLISMRPVILNSIVHNGKVYANQILIEEVSKVILKSDINYSKMISIQRNEQGEVIATNVDSQSINRIKIEIAQNIMEEFAQKGSYTYNIQLGTLLGNEFLIGRGQDIQMKIFPVGIAQTNVISEFESVGINQVKHILILQVSLEYNTIVPMNKSQGIVTSEFMLAETTIVGEVPQFYANLK